MEVSDRGPGFDVAEALGRRTRWSAVIGLTYPLALYFGLVYLAATRQSGLRAQSHRLTLFALGVAATYAGITLLVIVSV